MPTFSAASDENVKMMTAPFQWTIMLFGLIQKGRKFQTEIVLVTPIPGGRQNVDRSVKTPIASEATAKDMGKSIA